MCGIFYCTQKCHSSPDAAALLKPRGPDEEHIYDIPNNKGTAIFQRLAINDTISVYAQQPMILENVAMMCNGEIFNHKHLEFEYGIKCRSKSDCEVLIHLYNLSLNAAKFLDMLREINGDFALFIYDFEKNMILLSRDRVGVRPLFYGFTPSGEFMVASEMKSLYECATGQIHHVLPGSLFTIDLTTKKSCITFYHKFDYIQPTLAYENVNLRQLLFSSVQLRLMTDRPIGCLLSGGLDSSIITAILCKLLGPSNVRTYSIGMEGSLDLKYARIVAKYLGTQHTEVLFTPQEGLEILPTVIRVLESYDITTVRASVGMYLLGKYISEHTTDKVIFSGEGSDELMCGYLYFHNAPSGEEAHIESIRLMSELYLYDCLRADRCISSNGMELRVPFLDKNVINFCAALPGDLKKPKDGIEKRLLRETFEDLLPKEVAWRRKDGFSDGVSSAEKSWYEYIQEFVEKQVDDKGDCISKEAYYYKSIYDREFPHYPNPIENYWMPKWSKTADPTNPSGRIVNVA